MRRIYAVPLALILAFPAVGYAQSRFDDREVVVSQTEAEQAAVGEVPGAVVDSQLSREGSLAVWDVQVQTEDGQAYDVAVDGSTGEILASAPALPQDGVSP